MKKSTLFLGFLLLIFSSVTEAKIPQKEIKNKIKKNLSSFRDCYTEVLKTNSKLEGKVVLDWDIDDAGSVKRAEVKTSTLKDATVESCMLDKLKAIQFPSAPAGQVMNVNYPFVFTAKHK